MKFLMLTRDGHRFLGLLPANQWFIHNQVHPVYAENFLVVCTFTCYDEHPTVEKLEGATTEAIVQKKATAEAIYRLVGELEGFFV